MEIGRWLRNQWDRALAGVVVVASGLVLVLGYRGVANAELPAEQIPYLASAGLFGVFLLGIGSTLWLSADLHDEWRKLDEILRAQTGVPEADESDVGDVSYAASASPKDPTSNATGRSPTASRPARRPVRASGRA